MAKDIADILLGEDMEGGEVFCDDIYNNLKNHWRADYAGDPCAVLTEQLGMIISDAHDDRLYHITTGPVCTEIVQGNIPISDEVAVIFGDGSDGLIYYDEAVNDELVIEARNAAEVEGVTVNLLETNQRFRVRQNADVLSIYLTTTDAYLTWSDGALNLQNTEAGADAEVHIHGAGVGKGYLKIHDEDDAERLEFYCTNGTGRIRTIGAAPGAIEFQHNIPQDIICWNAIPSGNPDFYWFGWITAGGAPRYGRMRVDDTWDEVVLESENNANLEGVSVSLLETNQRFRVRQNADYMAMYLDGSDAFLTWSDGTLNLQTEEVDTNSEIHIHGAGTGRGYLKVYDEDDAEYLELLSFTGLGIIRTGGAAPSSLYFQNDIPQDIRCWSAIAAGNPIFAIYGWNTAAGAVVHSRFQMEDTYDEFFIEAEANANHEGITVSLLEAAQRFRVRGIAGAERFWVDEAGILGYTREGELRQWTYQGDLADDASFTLPAFTDSCWGFIQAGANEEYALFSVDDDGDVTLISNSANVVANADTEDKLCIGTAATQEGLVIRNRLDATKNINLIIWYS